MVNEQLNKLLKLAQGDRSQNQFAMHCGVSSATFSHLLQGKHVPSAKFLKKVADRAYNGVTYEDLLQATIAPYLEEKKSVMERPTSETAENFIRENMDLLKEKAFVQMTKLYKLLNDAQKIYVVAYLMGYMQREGVDTSSIDHF